MKKLLSMLAVSTLVGTSASNLKPLFTSNVSQGFKSSQTNKNINTTTINKKKIENELLLLWMKHTYSLTKIIVLH